MPDYTTETRTFLGIDGFGGYRRDRVYLLRYLQAPNGQVAIQADHEPGKPALVMSEQLFARWWSPIDLSLT